MRGKGWDEARETTFLIIINVIIVIMDDRLSCSLGWLQALSVA